MKKIIFSIILLVSISTQARLQGHLYSHKNELKKEGSNEPRWIRINLGNEISADAVAGGKDQDGTDLFIAHANYQGNWHPGKTRKDWNAANIEYGGAEVSVENYEVLVGGSNLNWISTSHGNMPANAIAGGHEENRTLFICRCQYEGSTQLGKTWQGNSSCNIGFGGNGYTIRDYEVLVSGPTIVSSSSTPMVTSNANCLPTEIVNSSQNNIMSFSYDDNDHINGLVLTVNEEPSNYAVNTDEQGKIISIINQGIASGFMPTKIIYTYDQQNVLKEVQEFLATSVKPTHVETYTYNLSGQLIQLRQAVIVTTRKMRDTTIYSYNIYSYPNTTTKNPDTIKVYNGSASGKVGTPKEIKILTYDDNKKNMGGAFPGTTDDYSTFATNNVISADITYVMADVKETRVSTFQYNAAGYPISKTYKANGGIEFTDTYSYGCK